MIQEHFFYIVDDQGCYSWILMFYDLGLKKPDQGSGLATLVFLYFV
jgi:hypothetical protein